MTRLSLHAQATIWINVHNGVGRHGHFLTAFAECFSVADGENRDILQPVSQTLIQKYKLDQAQYLEER